jgi:hypothetical protein
MVEVDEDLQTLAHDGVAFGALYMGDKADAACVVFVVRVVQALSRRHRHRASPKERADENSAAQHTQQAF